MGVFPANIIVAALLGMAHAQDGNPTSLVHVEIHTDYAAHIELHTKYLTMDRSTTKYLGNDQYLTEITSTTTIDSQETTIVLKPKLEVTKQNGDTSVIFAPSLQDELDTIVKEAVVSCGGSAKLRKRQGQTGLMLPNIAISADTMPGGSCVLDRLAAVAEDSNAFAVDHATQWQDLGLEFAENAPAILTHYANRFSTVGMAAAKNRFLIYTSAAAAAGVSLYNSSSGLRKVPQVFYFSGSKVGKPKDDSPTATNSQVASTSGCDPEATANENSPVCEDDNCKGENKKCTVDNDEKGCPCAHWADREIVDDHWDQDWMDFQQKYLGELLSNLPDVLPPSCFRNSFGDNFEGKPNADPSAFCHCSSKGASDGSMVKGNFPTMTGEGDAACTYTSMPDKTIEISTREAPTPPPKVTSCRLESKESRKPYCTCNDDNIHGETKTTLNAKETTVCPDFALSTGRKKVVKIILENQRTGVPPTEPFWDKCNWLFYSTDGDIDVRCQTDLDPVTVAKAEGIVSVPYLRKRQWPSGNFRVKTQDGECEYRNDGKGNTGALWCGDKEIKCVDEHDLDSVDKNGFESCKDIPGLEDKRLGEGLKGWIHHMEVITCAWE